MSFLEYKDRISEGDTVILYIGASSMHSIVVSSSKVHQTKYGAFPHAEMIGRQFGSKMFSINKKGWIYLLHPTSELWTINLPHRTQILYTTDISMAIMKLDIKPGSVVIESGTGSASMSHALIRAVAPTGHLYTFEFHEDRCKKAREEFKQHKVDHLVTIQHRDVLQEGFQLDHVADAVFLDLPSPWDAIATSKKAFKKKGGRICSFSPCIEQVQRTCETMTELGFKDIEVMECLLKSYDVKPVTMQVPEFSETLQQTHDDDSQKELDETTTVNTDELYSRKDKKTDDAKPSHILKMNKTTVMTAKPIKEMPGHTGFLTFASLYPNRISSDSY